jgi:hypothetical protein
MPPFPNCRRLTCERYSRTQNALKAGASLPVAIVAACLELLNRIPGFALIGSKPLLKLAISIAIDFIGKSSATLKHCDDSVAYKNSAYFALPARQLEHTACSPFSSPRPFAFFSRSIPSLHPRAPPARLGPSPSRAPMLHLPLLFPSPTFPFWNCQASRATSSLLWARLAIWAGRRRARFWCVVELRNVVPKP